MRRLLVFCAFVFLAGCGAKNASQGLVNGQCGVVQDACLLGTPSGTGDTSAPYAYSFTGSVRAEISLKWQGYWSRTEVGSGDALGSWRLRRPPAA